MLSLIGSVQIVVFVFFATLERLFPHYKHPVAPKFDLWWLGLGVFALVWLRGLAYWWAELPGGWLSLEMPLVAQAVLFYLVYSFGNYWIHRVKHSNRWLWKYLHSFHHSPSHMETRVAFYRHPTEIVFNTIYLIFLGKVVFGAPVEVLLLALTIEGCLECFHHSNIRISKRFNWLGYVIQLPCMHLVHHEYGLHRFNYAPFLWDTVFGTAKIPDHWDKRLGLAKSRNILALFLFR